MLIIAIDYYHQPVLDWLSTENGETILIRIAATIMAVILLGVLQFVFRLIVKRVNWVTPEHRLRWLAVIRNLALLLMFITVTFIWLQHLQSLMIALAAFAVACVVATKELLMCILGSVLRTGNGSFRIGDVVEIGDHKGEVIDSSLLTTKLFEHAPQEASAVATGRVIVIPNSVYLNSPVINETYTHRHILHVMTIPIKHDEHWQLKREILLTIAMRECEEELTAAEESFKKDAVSMGMKMPNIQPRVSVRVNSVDQLSLSLRIPVKSRQRNRIESSIHQQFFAETFHLLKGAAKEDEESEG